jgi:hypothetical protein
MDAVYAKAFLTICVLDGENMCAAIPGVSEPYYGRIQVITETE